VNFGRDLARQEHGAKHLVGDVQALLLAGRMSFHDWVAVTLVLYCMRSLENTQKACTCPARQTSRFSDGLFTFEAMWLPTSWVAASPPDLYGR